MSTAVFIPGFAETYASAEPLAKELSEGEFAIYDSIDIVPVADAIAAHGRTSDIFKNNRLITHSAGIVPEFLAAEYIALNGPEPTPLRTTIVGGMKVSKVDEYDLEPGVETLGMIEQGLDLMRHPIINLSIPIAIRKFSTAEALVRRTQGTTKRALMFTTTEDEFTFYRQAAVDYAQNNGVATWVDHGRHNEAMLKPRLMAKYIFEKYSQR